MTSICIKFIDCDSQWKTDYPITPFAPQTTITPSISPPNFQTLEPPESPATTHGIRQERGGETYDHHPPVVISHYYMTNRQTDRQADGQADMRVQWKERGESNDMIYQKKNKLTTSQQT